MPAAALSFSPWIDMTLTGDSMVSEAGADLIVTRGAMERRVCDYAGGERSAARRHSPLFADLHGLSHH